MQLFLQFFTHCIHHLFCIVFPERETVVFRGIPQDSLLFPILLKNENQQRVYCCFLYYRTIFEKSQSTFMTISTSFFSCFVAHFTKAQHFPE